MGDREAKPFFYKTKLCKFYRAPPSGRCKRGSKCLFAHGTVDKVPRPDFHRTQRFYRTHLCPSLVRTGSCGNKGTCLYAHSEQDLSRDVSKASSNAGLRAGSCGNRGTCRYAHSEPKLSSDVSKATSNVGPSREIVKKNKIPDPSAAFNASAAFNVHATTYPKEDHKSEQELWIDVGKTTSNAAERPRERITLQQMLANGDVPEPPGLAKPQRPREWISLPESLQQMLATGGVQEAPGNLAESQRPGEWTTLQQMLAMGGLPETLGKLAKSQSPPDQPYICDEKEFITVDSFEIARKLIVPDPSVDTTTSIPTHPATLNSSVDPTFSDAWQDDSIMCALSLIPESFGLGFAAIYDLWSGEPLGAMK